MTAPARPDAAPPGTLVIISGPSGSGKTTLVRRLLQRHPEYRRSVSVTTRAPRSGEVEGRDYHFVGAAEFERLNRDGALLEWSDHFNHSYGTPRRPVAEALAAGAVVVLEIDVNGACQVKAAMPEACSVFVRAPSDAALADRLRGRQTETEALVRERLARVRMETECAARFDRQVVNDDLERCVAEVEAFIESQARSRHAR